MIGFGHSTTRGGTSGLTGCEHATHELARMIAIGADSGHLVFVRMENLCIRFECLVALADLLLKRLAGSRFLLREGVGRLGAVVRVGYDETLVLRLIVLVERVQGGKCDEDRDVRPEAQEKCHGCCTGVTVVEATVVVDTAGCWFQSRPASLYAW